MFEDETCIHGTHYDFRCGMCIEEGINRRPCWTAYVVRTPYWCPVKNNWPSSRKKEKLEDYESSCQGCVYYERKSG